MTERSVFLAALDISDASDRLAYLEQACAAEPGLRPQVEQLLKAHQEADGFMNRPAPDLVATLDRPIAERPGTVIGPYKLLEQIGEGGFGVVFMAEQQQPVRRKVALKVLKPGMDTRQVVARFEAERQALALMDHPNIAHVFDGGTVGQALQPDSDPARQAGQPELLGQAGKPDLHCGRPYFVMELVRGVPITEFCDESCLGIRQRLELFIDVCQAVQHAHQKGVIHRDIKPTNVMVTLHDGQPVVKVIDFGIAKAMGQQLTEKTLFTNFAQMIGTPLYMSPEQAELSGLDMDTRSDIYSLGVLLYELLTGTTPFENERLSQVGYDEMRRIIREEEPPKPSARISTVGQAASTASQRRQADPRKLSRLFRGELDWIVMKALEKDRNRRYATAMAFAADVERYLNDEPVAACPPSKWYRVRKLVRRNRGTFAMTAVLVVVALLAVANLAVSNAMIRREQKRTELEKDRVKSAQELAEQRAEQIRDELERLKTANALLDRSRAYVIASRWDDAHASLTKAVELRPDHASAWAELADLHTRLGLWDLAATDFAHELELREPDLPLRWYLLALLHLHTGDVRGYHDVGRRMRAHFRGTSNMEYLIGLVRASVLSPDVDVDREQCVELGGHAVAGHAQPHWGSLYVLGLALYRAGQHDEAVRRLETSLRADDMPWSSRGLSYFPLAMAYHRLGQVAQARAALGAGNRVLDHWTEEMYQRSADDERWVNHLGATAYWPIAWWDWLEGRLFCHEAKLLIDGAPPPDDPRRHVLRARALAGLRRHREAEAEYALALERLPRDRQIALEDHRNRGYGCIEPGQWKQAAGEFDRAIELEPNDALLRQLAAVTHLRAGEVDAFRKTCAAMIERFENTQDIAVACCVLRACVLRPDALADMGRLVSLVRLATPSEGLGPAEASAGLYRAGQYAEAVGRFEAAERVYRLRPWASYFLAMARHRLGRVAEARQAFDEAARWTDEADREKSDDLTATRPSWGAWYEPLECKLLLEEAKQLLETPVTETGS